MSFVVALLCLMPRANACTGIGGYSLSTPGPIPVDANIVVTGVAVFSVTVFDAAEAKVAGTTSSACSATDTVVDHYCKVAFKPESFWLPGATYTVRMVSGEYASSGHYPESTGLVLIEADGHRVTPVTGVPTIATARRIDNDTGITIEPCPNYEVTYDLTVSPSAPDPDGLSYVRVERRDYHTRIKNIGSMAEPFEWTIDAPAPDTGGDCFRVTQVDGAGNESESSDWACAEVETADAEGCGCSGGSPTGAGVGVLLLATAFGFVARRQASEPEGSSGRGTSAYPWCGPSTA